MQTRLSDRRCVRDPWYGCGPVEVQSSTLTKKQLVTMLYSNPKQWLALMRVITSYPACSGPSPGTPLYKQAALPSFNHLVSLLRYLTTSPPYFTYTWFQSSTPLFTNHKPTNQHQHVLQHRQVQDHRHGCCSQGRRLQWLQGFPGVLWLEAA
jgi:hypothetical protein